MTSNLVALSWVVGTFGAVLGVCSATVAYKAVDLVWFVLFEKSAGGRLGSADGGADLASRADSRADGGADSGANGWSIES